MGPVGRAPGVEHEAGAGERLELSFFGPSRALLGVSFFFLNDAWPLTSSFISVRRRRPRRRAFCL